MTRSGCAMSGRRFGAVSARISRTPARPSRPVRAPVERTEPALPLLQPSVAERAGSRACPRPAHRRPVAAGRAGGSRVVAAGRLEHPKSAPPARQARHPHRPGASCEPLVRPRHPATDRHPVETARPDPRLAGPVARPHRGFADTASKRRAAPDSATATRPRRTVASRGLTLPAAGTLSACPLTPSTPPLTRPMTIPLAPPRHTGRNPAGARHPLRPRPAFRALPCRTPQTGVARPSLMPDSRTRIASSSASRRSGEKPAEGRVGRRKDLPHRLLPPIDPSAHPEKWDGRLPP